MAESDEEIRVRFSVEDAGASTTVLEIREAMDELIQSARDTATEFNQTLSVAFASVRIDKIDELNRQLKEAKATLKSEKGATVINQEEVKKAENSIEELTRKLVIYKEAGRQGLSEVSKEATKFSQVLSNLGKIQRTSIESNSEAQREYEKITRQGYGVMSDAAKQYGQQIEQIKQEIVTTSDQTGQTWQQVAENMQRAGVPINQINTALQQLNAQTQQTSSVFGSFGTRINNFVNSLGSIGSVGKYVFSTILGVTAIAVLRDLARAFKDFAEDIINRGKEMSEVMFTFQVAIRGLQRTGMDTTIDEWTKSIENLKKQFPFFPKREFIEATSLAALMTREFGFAADQIENVVRMSAILAQITGKDLNEAVRGVTYAIGSGYFESLQRAGVNISRQIVANEALRQGYEGVYNELEQTVRAQITYNVIQQNLAAIQDDAALKTETFAGQVQILNATLEDMKNLFGEVVTSSDTMINTLKKLNEALKSVYELYEALASFDVDIFAPLKYLTGLDTIIRNVDAFVEVLDRLKETLAGLAVTARYAASAVGAFATVLGALGFEDVEEALKGLQEEIFNTSRALQDLAGTEDIEIDTTIGDVKFSEDDYKEIIGATEELGRKVNEINEEYEDKRLKIREDYQKDVEKNKINHDRKLEDLEEDHQQRLDDIRRKYEQRVADENTNYEYRVADAVRDAAQRREDAERKYRERELREERKFQEKLRQLRENFLLDLEDAVRERDARQIIRLTRQYNLRRDQMIREEKLNKTDRQEAFQEELRDIERQKEERLRQLYVEHQRRLEELALQAERERASEQTEYERKQADESRRWDEQKAERNARLAEQFADLKKWRTDRIAEVIDGLREEYGLTKDQLDAMVLLWNQKFGPTGEIASAVSAGVDATIDHMQRLAQYMNAFYTSLGGIGSVDWMSPARKALQGGYDISNYEYAGPQAEGGTIIARKPTVAIFGEKTPEMATFTPLSDVGSTSPAKIMPSDLPTGKDGLIRLEMLLSPDLEARVIDNTLSEIADVNFRIERARK